MLLSLHLKNLAIVDSADLELNPGMTAITGETGVGKSILIDGLSLVLGGRADSGIVGAAATAPKSLPSSIWQTPTKHTPGFKNVRLNQMRILSLFVAF